LIDLHFCLDAVDYWWDSGFLESQRRLQRLSDDEWGELRQIWPLQSTQWQERLAYMLGDPAIPREVELLVAMFTNGSREVSLDAASALRHIQFETLQSLLVSAWVEQNLPIEGLLNCASVNELLNTIKSG
jgi:HEAT repeat protein